LGGKGGKREEGEGREGETGIEEKGRKTPPLGNEQRGGKGGDASAMQGGMKGKIVNGASQEKGKALQERNHPRVRVSQKLGEKKKGVPQKRKGKGGGEKNPRKREKEKKSDTSFEKKKKDDFPFTLFLSN